MVQVGETQLLFDTSQDFYQQMLAYRVQRIDAVLYSHGHADHIYGLPDIRSYCRAQGGSIDIYGSRETLDTLYHAFDYVFDPPDYVGGGIPSLTSHELTGPQSVQGVSVTPIPVEHGPLQGCLGYRVDDDRGRSMAYIPDVKHIPPASLQLLENLDLLILNCLRMRPHTGHLTIEESLAYARQIRPRRCLFTHMSHDIDFQIEGQDLPDWCAFAYDGLVVTLCDDGTAPSV
jgi:phosphoribosyl 1,2-cyclic phosphate phosphodiesterase